jgi:hypothetical protein
MIHAAWLDQVRVVSYNHTLTLGSRLMVGQQTLDLHVRVRLLPPQMPTSVGFFVIIYPDEAKHPHHPCADRYIGICRQ